MSTSLISVPGFHAVKHALRFKADIVDIVAVDDGAWRKLVAGFASDIEAELTCRVRLVSAQEFKVFSPGTHPTGIVALAWRPVYQVDPAADLGRAAPAILLENPRRLGNIGAVIRVAAAAGAGCVLVAGDVDPWHAEAVQGSAGLHFALPVVKVGGFDEVAGPIIAMDAGGMPIQDAAIPPNAILAFGTEREGLTGALRGRAGMVVSLSMRQGVSSLNLATSVAATLYSLKARP